MALLQFINLAGSSGGGSSGFNITYPSGTTAGTTLVLPILWKNSNGVVTGVTDDQSQTWTSGITAITMGNYKVGFWYFQNTAASASVIHVATSAPCNHCTWLAEESGIATSGSVFDSTAVPVGQLQTAVTSFSSGAMTSSTQANLVLYGFSASQTSANVSYAA